MKDDATRLIAGCMTGTSIDGLDAALVEIRGSGLTARPRFVRAVSRGLGDVGPRLRRLAEQEPMTAAEIAELSRSFASLHVAALRDLIGRDSGGTGVLDLVCIHGQTVYHKPPVSWQVFTPAVVAEALRVPIVSDLRAADLAAGGQGAPITPLADWLTLGKSDEARAVVNLGGFCNVTLLPVATGDAGPGGVRGFDVCACNHLLDTVARRSLGKPFDEGGASAVAGHVNEDALDDLRGVLIAQSAAKRSLGTGDEVSSWIGRHRVAVDGPDLAATASEAIAEMVSQKVAGVDRVLIAGGGVKNAALVRAIGACCSARVEPTDAYGVPAAFREAMAMAVLGAMCQDKVAITLPAVTGSSWSPVSGTWTSTSGSVNA